METKPAPKWKDWLRRGWVVLPLLWLGIEQCSLRAQLQHRQSEGAFQTLQVERLEVVNEEGYKVVVVGSLQGMGVVAVGDQQGNPRLSLEGDSENGHLKLRNQQQELVVHLGTDDKGNGGVEVHTAKGAAHLGASTTGTPALSLNTSGATLFLGSRNDNDQEPVISLSQGRETRVRIEALEHQGMIRVWGPGEHFGNAFMPRY